MGKRTKLREAQKRAAEQALAAQLRAHSRQRRRDKARDKAFIASYSEFPPEFRTRIKAYERYALRPPENWRCHVRVRCAQKRFLELVQFSFARFPVVPHLANAWLPDPAEPDIEAPGNILDFRLCYIVAGRGGSPYRECLRAHLSRLEAHHFLTAPPEVASSQRALWYSMARVHTDDVRVAVRIARTKLVAFPIAIGFWREVARFFAHNPTTTLEMNDLIDYLEAETAEEPSFDLSGRTLQALRGRMEAWHTMLRTGVAVSRDRWAGSPLPNAVYEYDDALWRLTQIKTGIRLFEEGEKMRHCVVMYLNRCIRGESSIWSLTCERNGRVLRCATIELLGQNIIAQARAFANGLPSMMAFSVIEAWAKDYGLSWSPGDFGVRAA
jgi:hypothetical protein